MTRGLVLAAPLAGMLSLPAAADDAQDGTDALPDGMARARIGELTLYHDPAAWRIEGEAGAWAIHCRGPYCDAPAMSVVAVPAELTQCSPGAVVDRSVIDYPDPSHRQVAMAGAVALAVHVATLDQGCRNLAGAPIYACTLHQGMAYWFIAPGELCQMSVAESEALQRLLNGLAPAALTAR